MKKKVEVIICDLCIRDVPAVSHVTILGLGRELSRDLCRGHTNLLKTVRRQPEVPIPDEARLPCPECDFKAQNPQGLGIHRRQTHGVRGTSRLDRKVQAA